MYLPTHIGELGVLLLQSYVIVALFTADCNDSTGPALAIQQVQQVPYNLWLRLGRGRGEHEKHVRNCQRQ